MVSDALGGNCVPRNLPQLPHCFSGKYRVAYFVAANGVCGCEPGDACHAPHWMTDRRYPDVLKRFLARLERQRFSVGAIVAAYVLFATAWLVVIDLVTDGVLDELTYKPRDLVIDLATALAFVLVTAILLRALLRRHVQQLQAQTTGFRLIAEKASDGIVVLRADLRLVYANDAASRLLGYRNADLIGRPLDVFLGEAEAASLRDHARRQERQPLRSIWKLRQPGGDWVTVDAATQPLSPRRHLAVLRDVSAAQAEHRQVAYERGLLRTMINAMSDLIWLKDTSGVYLIANDALVDAMCRAGTIEGKVDADLHSPEAARVFRESDARIIAAGAARVSRLTHDFGIGPRRYLTIKTPVRGVDGAVTGVLGIARDVTEYEEAQERLRASEEFIRAVLDSVDARIAVLDRHGTVLSVNDAWRSFAATRPDRCGAHARAEVGVNYVDACATSDDSCDDAPACGAGVREVLAGKRSRFTAECRSRHDSGDSWYLLNATPLQQGGGGAVLSYVDITELRAARASKEEATRQLQALAGQQVAIQEAERKNLSRELHDEIGQTLTVLKLALGRVRRQAQGAGASLDEASAIVDGLSVSIRDISRRLRPPMIDDLGLAATVRWYLAGMQRTTEIQYDLQENLDQQRLDAAIELAVFRVLQEAVSNVLRHAEATSVEVGMELDERALTLTVVDDGVGFSAPDSLPEQFPPASLGLIGMRERVAALRGEFSIVSHPGSGTEVRAVFPVAGKP